MRHLSDMQRTAIEEVMAVEQRGYGSRKLYFRDSWAFTWTGLDGELRGFRVVVYDIDPMEIGDHVMHESRWVMVDGNGRRIGGGIVDPMEDP